MNAVLMSSLPLTWFVADVVALALYVVCLVHAGRHEQAAQRLTFLFGCTVYAGVFENVYVHSGTYFYDLHRISLVGTVPLGVLMMEAVIVYSAYILTTLLRLPASAKAFAVGFLASLQDLTIDPTAVHDMYDLGSGAHGQWTWAQHYSGDYFGIPFFNFSGWFTFAFMFVAAFELLTFMLRRRKWEDADWALYLLPFASTGLAFGLLSVAGGFMVNLYQNGVRWAELTMMLVDYAIGIFCLVRFSRLDRPFDLKREGFVLLLIPFGLHSYDIIVAFARGLNEAYLPVLLFTAIHGAGLWWLFRQIRCRTLASTFTYRE